MSLTRKQVRRLALASQGLLKNDQMGRGVNAAERVIQRLGYIQIDTISVVERAHHHVLRTRVGNYSEQMLYRLLSERRAIFEYWSHAAAFLPSSAYRFYLPLMRGYASQHHLDPKLKKWVLDRITAEGPLQARDFDDQRAGKSTGWWDRKPSKIALEHLFFAGELMVAERRGINKVYDLTERLLHSDTETSIPTEEERAHFYVKRMLSALGVATASEIGYDRTAVSRISNEKIQPMIDKALVEMVEAGEILQIEYAGKPYFIFRAALDALPTRISRPQLRVLSPFDNLIINRQRLRKLFDFDYQLECYLPEEKRQYGYFALPLLLGDQFVGRMDCKILRPDSRLVIRNLCVEPGVATDEEMAKTLSHGLRSYAKSLGCQHIDILTAVDKKLRRMLKP